jgi:hypothetical protein
VSASFPQDVENPLTVFEAAGRRVVAALRQKTRCRQAETLDGPPEKSSETKSILQGTAGLTASSRVIAPNTKRAITGSNMPTTSKTKLVAKGW